MGSLELCRLLDRYVKLLFACPCHLQKLVGGKKNEKDKVSTSPLDKEISTNAREIVKNMETT